MNFRKTKILIFICCIGITQAESKFLMFSIVDNIYKRDFYFNVDGETKELFEFVKFKGKSFFVTKCKYVENGIKRKNNEQSKLSQVLLNPDCVKSSNTILIPSKLKEVKSKFFFRL
jgi:hypothetical protein